MVAVPYVIGLVCLAGIVAGACLGSFIAALTLRWPQGRSIATGRSMCENCHRTLTAFDLVPIVSYLALAGACRACRAPIGNRQLVIEVTAGAIGGLSLAISPDTTGAVGAVFGWALLPLLVLDIEHFWLPDRLTWPLAAGGIIAAWLTQADVAMRLVGLVAGFASLWLVAALYKRLTGRVGIGGGDPKLFAAIGAWLGPQGLPYVLVLAGIFGLIMAAFSRWRGTDIDRQTPLAYGALMATAAWPLWFFVS